MPHSIILNHSMNHLPSMYCDSCNICISTHKAWCLAMFCCVYSTSPFLAWNKQSQTSDYGHLSVNVLYFRFVLAWWCGDGPYQLLQCQAKDSVCPSRKGMNEESHNILTILPLADKNSCLSLEHFHFVVFYIFF